MREPASRTSLGILFLLLLVQVTGCAVTATEDNDTSNTFVSVVAMTGESAEEGGLTAGSDIFSDICVTSMDNPNVCIALNDNGIVIMVGQPKNQIQLASTVQDVVFTRYRVTYIRADGRNVPGVDVPFPFDGVAQFRVPVDGTQVTRNFMVVRQQAKLESPLRELRGLGGAQLISTIAQVDFFGRDIAGRQVKVTGFLNISFGDF